jgi:hypothetical protein
MYDAVADSGINKLGSKMKKTAFLFLILATATYPAVAKPYHHNQGHQHAGAGHTHQAYTRQAHHAGHAYRGHPGNRQVYQASRPSTDAGSHSNITCDMVRSYVAQVGLAQARAMAVAAGMSAAEERRARQCLANRV